MECDSTNYDEIYELARQRPEIVTCVKQLLGVPQLHPFRVEYLGAFQILEVVDLLLTLTPQQLRGIAGLRSLKSARIRGITPLEWSDILDFVRLYTSGRFQDMRGEEYNLQRNLAASRFRFEVRGVRTQIIELGERSLFLYPSDLSVRNVERISQLQGLLDIETLTISPAISVEFQDVMRVLPQLNNLQILTPLGQYSAAISRMWVLLQNLGIIRFPLFFTAPAEPTKIREEAENLATFLSEQQPIPQLLEFNGIVSIRHISQLQRLLPNLTKYHLWVEAGEEALTFTLPSEKAVFYAASWNPPEGDEWSRVMYTRIASIEDSLSTPMLVSA